MPDVSNLGHVLQPSAKKHNYETENFWLDKYKYLEAEAFYALGNGFFRRLLASGGDPSATMDQFMKRFDLLEKEQKAMQQQLNQMSRGILDQLAAIQKQLGVPSSEKAEVTQSAPAVTKPDATSALTEEPSNGTATAPAEAVTAPAGAVATPNNDTTTAAKSNIVQENETQNAVEDGSAANGAKKKRRKKPTKNAGAGVGAAGDVAETKSEVKSEAVSQQGQTSQGQANQPQQAQQTPQPQKQQQNSQKQQKAQKPQQQQQQQSTKSQTQQQPQQKQQKGAPAVAKASAKEEDDIDLFGSDEEEESAEATRVREERLKQYAEKKSAKPALIAKSNVILDVKPWDDETDMKKLEETVRTVTMDGLLWGQSKLVPLAYGIKKLQISCVVEDDKVSIEELSEKLQEFEDFVQSVDIAAFNKI